jgi:membrane protein DedA with SNARE-associated domain
MESLLSGFSTHGYAILLGFVFLESIGLPVPAALALLVAGAASAHGSISFPVAFAASVAAMILGDALMFILGRLTGWWLLGILCRISLNPDSCIIRSADSFHRRGRVLLLFAKFIPGINTMAPPMAGSMNMRVSQFAALDLAGAILYTGSYLGAGFLFSGALEIIAHGYHVAGRIVGWILLAAIATLLVYRAWNYLRTRRPLAVPFVTPAEAAKAVSLNAGIIYDVRSHGYYDRNAVRIKGSQRLDPNTPDSYTQETGAGRPVYLYCTCIKEATSARVAQTLLDKGVKGSVIKGGLRAWKKAGLPVEAVPEEEVTGLPVFR